MIGGVQVSGFRYVAFGAKRGPVSTHRTKKAALRALAEDARARTRAGDQSDAEVYQWRGDGWVPLVPEVNVKLVNPVGTPPV